MSNNSDEKDNLFKKEDTNSEKESKTVKISLVDNEGNTIQLQVKRDVPLNKIVNFYAKRYNKDANQLRLSWKGRQVQKTDTPESLGFDDEEEMEVVTPQVGG